MSSQVVDRIVVVVPACDEEALIGGALDALRAAAEQVRPDATTTVVVVANGCTDGTVATARRMGATVIDLPTPDVGAARAAGMAWALEQHAGALDRLWLATTDADSRVDPRWLSVQLDSARDGADVYLGTVTLDAADRQTFAAWTSGYDVATRGLRRHGHVHGASMGVRAATYLAAGGFTPMAVGEDADLVARVSATGASICWDTTCPVITSARLAARAPAGVSRDLALSLEVDEAV